MRIIQITDLHLGQAGEDTYGIDVRANFIKILAEVKRLSPDFLVITGDFCFKEPQRSIYQWALPRVEALNIPFKVIAGNHDDPVMLAQEFQHQQHLSENELYYQETWGEWPVFFLDTSTAHLSIQQLAWLKVALSEVQRDTIIFMHHPPITSMVPYMDLHHHFKDQKIVLDLLGQLPFRVHIFTGHYHVDKIINHQNISVYITPACFFQINQYQLEFAADHQRIGLRVIELEDEKLLSTVHYFEGNQIASKKDRNG